MGYHTHDANSTPPLVLTLGTLLHPDTHTLFLEYGEHPFSFNQMIVILWKYDFHFIIYFFFYLFIFVFLGIIVIFSNCLPNFIVLKL